MPPKDNTMVYVLAGGGALCVSISLGLFIWWYITTQNKGEGEQQQQPGTDAIPLPPPTMENDGRCEGDACDQCPQGFMETSGVCAATAGEDKKQCWHPLTNHFSRRVCKTAPECVANQAGVAKVYNSEVGYPIGYKPTGNGAICIHPQTGQKIRKPRLPQAREFLDARRKGTPGYKTLFKKKNSGATC